MNQKQKLGYMVLGAGLWQSVSSSGNYHTGHRGAEQWGV